MIFLVITSVLGVKQLTIFYDHKYDSLSIPYKHISSQNKIYLWHKLEVNTFYIKIHDNRSYKNYYRFLLFPNVIYITVSVFLCAIIWFIHIL